MGWGFSLRQRYLPSPLYLAPCRGFFQQEHTRVAGQFKGKQRLNNYRLIFLFSIFLHLGNFYKEHVLLVHLSSMKFIIYQQTKVPDHKTKLIFRYSSPIKKRAQHICLKYLRIIYKMCVSVQTHKEQQGQERNKLVIIIKVPGNVRNSNS